MTTHKLKTHPAPFAAVAAGLKTCEFRLNDRGYKVGDVLVLEEFVPEQGERPKPGEAGSGWSSERYTGAYAVRGVTHVLCGPAFGIPADYCLLSLSGSGSTNWKG